MQSEERIVSVSRDEAAEADQTRESGAAKSVRLTARDAKLLGHLAVARYLSSRQIAQLVFSGCVDRVVRRRLNLLATPAGAVAHIAPLKYRSYNGTPMVAWKLTESGYARAEQALGRELKIPVKDASRARAAGGGAVASAGGRGVGRTRGCAVARAGPSARSRCARWWARWPAGAARAVAAPPTWGGCSVPALTAGKPRSRRATAWRKAR